MKITQLYTYPIKSLRSVPLTTTAVTPHGFPYDRRFMLIKIHGSTPSPPRSKSHFHEGIENMTITYFPELTLFLQSIDLSKGTFTVTYCPPDQESKSLKMSLEPEVAGLEAMDVSLHHSPTKAFKMNTEVSAWFSSCLGYDVVLAYLGPNRREVLGSLSPNSVSSKSAEPQPSWFSSISGSLPNILGSKSKEEVSLTFADCAAYLVVTEESLDDVCSRFSDGTKVDMTKFRPNIVLSGSVEAYEEDYWGTITISSGVGKEKQQETDINLTSNCGRCVSLNVDYKSGQFAKGEGGTVLKKMMNDRRVDKGYKYSPIFGRYGFSRSSDAGHMITVGDEVRVSKINEERTTFQWPGISS